MDQSPAFPYISLKSSVTRKTETKRPAPANIFTEPFDADAKPRSFGMEFRQQNTSITLVCVCVCGGWVWGCRRYEKD